MDRHTALGPQGPIDRQGPPATLSGPHLLVAHARKGVEPGIGIGIAPLPGVAQEGGGRGEEHEQVERFRAGRGIQGVRPPDLGGQHGREILVAGVANPAVPQDAGRVDDAVQAAEEIFRALHGLVRVVQACDIGLEIGGPLSQGLHARCRPLTRFRPSDQEHPGVEGVDEEGGEDRSQPTGAAADQVYATRFEGGSIIASAGQGFEPGLLADAVPIAHLHRLVREFVEQPIERDRTHDGEGLQQYP